MLLNILITCSWWQYGGMCPCLEGFLTGHKPRTVLQTERRQMANFDFLPYGLDDSPWAGLIHICILLVGIRASVILSSHDLVP